MRSPQQSQGLRNRVVANLQPKVARDRSFHSQLSVGVVAVDITPPIGISANPWGKSKSAISRGVHRPMEATVVALSSAANQVSIIIGMDIGWIGCYQCDVINFRSRMAAELELNIDDILVNLSQTHKGPPFCLHEPVREGGELVPAYIEKTISDLITAAKQAIASRQLAQLTWAYGKCALGSVRDLPVSDTDLNQVVVGYNPELTPDDTLVVGRVTAENGKVLATIVNYGCHPTSVGWDCDLISPDYVGRARELVTAATAAPMLFLLGACGNVAPKQQYSGDVTIADRNGEILGYATLATLATMTPPATELRFDQVITSGSNLASWLPVPIQPNQELMRKKIFLELKHKKLLSESEMRIAWAPLTASETFLDFRIRKQFEIRIDYVTENGSVRHPVWIWKLGDAIVIAHGGEAYLELARDLRLRNPDQMILFLDMTNGPGYMYLPTKLAYEQNNYQSQQSIIAAGGLEEMLELLDLEIKTL
jgi:hypothetical protein